MNRRPAPRRVSSGCHLWAVAFASTLLPFAAAAQALPEPTDPHPRLFLDRAAENSLRNLGRRPGTYVARVIDWCDDIGRQPGRHATDGYMGLDWAQYLQACLIAHKATGQQRHGETALVYFRALLDDERVVGDGKGGDMSAARDSGFAMRALGPNAALAYDWLHDFPGVDDEMKARARGRFRAWTNWYLENGYRARSPGTNYHAGYLFAASLIAVAQGSEAGPDGAMLWQHVIDDIFRSDTLPAMQGDGVLVGGDWGEGWQYGPLSVVEYAMAGSALAKYGLDISSMEEWLSSVFLRHVHALQPGPSALTFALGDTQIETPYLPVRAETLAAVILGPSTAQTKGWAEAELRRLNLYDDKQTFPLFLSLTEAAGVQAEAVRREELPTSYFSPGTGVLYARADWSDSSPWFAAMCSGVRDVDHMHPNAGNFVLSLGNVPVIVDPSPYGTLSTLTSNAPAVESGVLPREYSPSQGYWGSDTRFEWIRSANDGRLLVARCVYSGQFRLQDLPSDVIDAVRDFVLIAEDDGVHLVIFDSAQTASEEHRMHLRFRSPMRLKPSDDGYSGSSGGVRQSIRRIYHSAGEAELRRLNAGSCFDDRYTRGNCDAARFPVDEYRLVLQGNMPEAIHLVTATRGSTDEISVHVSREGNRRTVIADSPSSSYVILAGDDLDEPLFLPARDTTVILLGRRLTSLSGVPGPGGTCELLAGTSQDGDRAIAQEIVKMSSTCDVNVEGL